MYLSICPSSLALLLHFYISLCPYNSPNFVCSLWSLLDFIKTLSALTPTVFSGAPLIVSLPRSPPLAIPRRELRQERVLFCLVTIESGQPTQHWAEYISCDCQWLRSLCSFILTDFKPAYVQLEDNLFCLETGVGLAFLKQETYIEKEWGMLVFLCMKMELNSLLLKFPVLFHTIIILVLG